VRLNKKQPTTERYLCVVVPFQRTAKHFALGHQQLLQGKYRMCAVQRQVRLLGCSLGLL